MTIEQRIHQGSRAREILENEEFIASFEAIEREVIEQWTNSPARDAEGREKLWQYLTMLRKIKAQLTTTLESGKLAQLDLQHKMTLQERVKVAWRG